MSVIRKKPYIESVLESVLSTDTNKTNFSKALNGVSPFNENGFKTLVGSSKITSDDKGVKTLNLEFKYGQVHSGVLLYNDSYCAYLTYNNGNQNIEIYNLDLTNEKAVKVNEECSIEELRRTYGNVVGGSSWEIAMRSVMIYDSENNEVQIGTHCYIDGDCEVDQDVNVGRDLIVDAIANIQDPDGNLLFAPHGDGVTDGTYTLKVTKSGSGYTFNFVKDE